MPSGIYKDDTMVSGMNLVPWHGLGTVVDGALTAADALRLGGLDWNVELQPIFVSGQDSFGNTIPVEVEGHSAVMRDRDRKVLGVVKSSYCPLQNAEVFSFFDSLVSRQEAMYHTAGSLFGGRRVWVLAKLPGELRVMGEDVTEKFILLTTSHDGSCGFTAKVTPVRVVCQNTLNMALKGQGTSITIRHTSNIAQNVSKAAEMMGVVNTMYAQLQEAMNAMAAKEMREKDLQEFLNRCLRLDAPAASPDIVVADALGNVRPVPTTEDKSEKSRAKQAILELHEVGAGADMAAGTLWGAYNAVVEYVDHKKYRSADTRLKNAWFEGDSHSLKLRAFEEATKLLTV